MQFWGKGGASKECRIGFWPLTTDDWPLLLEPDHYRFRLQVHTPDLFHPLLNCVFESQYFSGRRSAAVDDGERVLARYADMAEAVTFGEA